jgi:hypothetical protein
MSTRSSFRINQPPGSPTTPYDRSRQDLVYGGANIELEAEQTSESSYLWTCVGSPPGVSVTVITPTANKTEIALPVDGPYMFNLLVNDGNPATESSTTLYAGTPVAGLDIPFAAFDETNQDNSQSPYDGARGHYDKTYEILRLSSVKLGAKFKSESSGRTIVAADEGKWIQPTTDAQTFTLDTITNFRDGADFFVTTGVQSAITVTLDANATTFIGVFTQVTGGWGTTPSKLKLSQGTSVRIKRFGSVWYAEVLGGKIEDADTPADTWNVGLIYGAIANTACAGNDSRLSDSRDPTNHASDHIDGTDDIQDSTSGQKGLATAAQITKLDGIETSADVTDATNVAAAGAQMTSEKDSANGYSGLDGSSKLTGSQQTYGSASDTACEGNDSRLSDARTPTAHDLDGAEHNGVSGATTDNLVSFTAAGKPQDSGKAIADLAGDDHLETIFMRIGRAEDGVTQAPAAEELITSTNGKVRVRKFDSSTDEDVIFPWEIPDDCKVADGIKFSVCGVITEATAPASGEGVAFQLSGYSIGIGDSINGTFGTAIVSKDADLNASGADTQYDRFKTTLSGTVTVTDLAAGELAMIHLNRDVSDSDDDYAQDVGVYGLLIQYTKTLTTP